MGQGDPGNVPPPSFWRIEPSSLSGLPDDGMPPAQLWNTHSGVAASQAGTPLALDYDKVADPSNAAPGGGAE